MLETIRKDIREITTSFESLISDLVKTDYPYEIALQQTIFCKKMFPNYETKSDDDFFTTENIKFHSNIEQKLSEIYFTITFKSPRNQERNLIYNLFNKKEKIELVDIKNYNASFFNDFDTVNEILKNEHYEKFIFYFNDCHSYPDSYNGTNITGYWFKGRFKLQCQW